MRIRSSSSRFAPHRRGVLAAFFLLSMALGGAIGDPLNGGIFDILGSYRSLFLLMSCLHEPRVRGGPLHPAGRGRGGHGTGWQRYTLTMTHTCTLTRGDDHLQDREDPKPAKQLDSQDTSRPSDLRVLCEESCPVSQARPFTQHAIAPRRAVTTVDGPTTSSRRTR